MRRSESNSLYRFLCGNVLWIVILLTGCTFEIRKVERIPVSLEDKKDISIFDVCSRIDLAPLATSDSVLLSMIYAKPYKGGFLIRQNNPQQVFCFDSTGALDFKISNLGRGDQEYAGLANVCVNVNDESLYLLETLDYLDQYDLKGNFQRKIALDSINDILNDVIPLNQDTLLVISGRKNLTYSFFSLKAQRVVDRYYDSIPCAGSNSPVFSDGKDFFRYSWHDRMVYAIQGTSFVPAFCWDFGKYNNAEEDFSDLGEKSMSEDELERYIMDKANVLIMNMKANADYLYVLLMDNTGKEPRLTQVWYNKNTQQYFVFEKFKEQVTWTYFDNLINHYFIGSVYAANKEETLNPDLLDEANKEIYHNVKSDDNPIMVKFRLK